MPEIMDKTTKKKNVSTKKLSKSKAAKRTSAKEDLLYEFGDIHPLKAKLKGQRIHGNEEKKRIAIDMLERYTGHDLKDFQKQVILTNFHYYVERFNELLKDSHYTEGSAFKASSSQKARVTIIEFGVGSAMAALIIELLAVVEPKAVLFLGLCGSVHHSLKVGDFILPIASIRAESVSEHFLPRQVPALPTFKIQKFVSQILVENGHEYRTGTIHSTDYRFWEFDETFKENLILERVLAVEMETAALFTTGFVSKVNVGALLLVSDCPFKKDGIKTKASAKKVFQQYTDIHIELGIEAMADIAERGERIRHYTW
ncbi:MAG: AMP nucleosidase [Halobacteriovoraceae bacterium]|nr:AMP nucleosidase [Halobacteriovoraceae bacterium]